MINKIEKALADLRGQKPLILNFTNFVTMDFVANCLLALGAAPIMSVCEDEIEELVKLASVVYINPGTLDAHFITLIKKAIAFANKYNKSIVFDPVGAGATKIRTENARYIVPFSTITRGNASEIIALEDNSFVTQGVEAAHTTDDAKEIANLLALKNKITVITSGPIDFVTNGSRSAQIAFGSPLMQQVTGMGCAMTAVVAAFKAVMDDPFEASLMSSHYFALCGEIAALQGQHSGSFRTAFIDQLQRADFKIMRKIYDKQGIAY